MKKSLLALILIFSLCMLVACLPGGVNPPPKDEENPQHTHVFGEWETIREATCTEEGEKRAECATCNYVESESIPATGHDIGMWYTAKEPTCTEEGEKRGDCKNCDYFESGPLPTVNHEYGDWINLEGATCTEVGKCRRECKNCDAYEVDSLPYHSYGEWQTITEPTCTEYGLMYRECTLCDAKEEREIKPTLHSFGPFETVKEPTCQETGLRVSTCAACGVQQNKTISKVSHNFGDFVVVVEATCQHPGEERRTCSFCGRYEKQVLLQKEHSFVTFTKEPTQTEYGYKKTACATCDDYTRIEYIPATGSTTGLAFSYLYNDTLGEIVYVSGLGEASGTDIVIPAVHDGKLVTGIAEYAFSDTAITSVVIPDTVTYIGDGAFLQCGSLTSISIGENVTICPGAFFGVAESAINTYEGVNYLGTKNNPYYYCLKTTNLNAKSVNLHEQTQYIAGGAFAYGELESVTIPDGVREIGIGAFSTSVFLKTVTIGKSTTEIRERAFENCPALETVYFGGALEKIRSFAFENSRKLKNIYYPKTVTEFEKIDWEHSSGETLFVVHCSDGDLKPNHPGEHEHVYTKPPLSRDGVMMSVPCDLCEEEKYEDVPACEHYLGSSIFDNSREVSCYICDKCKVYFSIPDIITVKITDYGENNCALYLSSKVEGVILEGYYYTFDSFHIIDESEAFDSEKDFFSQEKILKKLVVGENINVISLISLPYLETIVISPSVREMMAHCINDVFFLDEIYFEGDLPKIYTDTLYVRHTAENMRQYEPCAYYNKGAKGFEEYQYKIGAFALYQVGEVLPELPDYSVIELSRLSAERAVEIALEMFENGKKGRDYLQFIPFASLYAYKEIKDFTLELTKDCTDDLSRARTIFEWLVANIEYDDSARFYTSDCVFKTKKAVCAGYAMLYHDMLCAVKIPSLYLTGFSSFGTTVTAEELMYEPFFDLSDRYGNGHGWNLVYIDGDAVMVDATWGDFDLTPEQIAESGRVTLAIQGISTLPESIDPRTVKDILYYDNGEIYYMQDGQISAVDMRGFILNYSAQFDYSFRIPNDGRIFDERVVPPKNGYHDIFTDYGDFSTYYSNYHSSDFRTFAHFTVFRYLAFEKYYYGEDFMLDHSDMFFMENGIIYSVYKEGEVEVISTVLQGGAVIIPQTAGGYRVTKIAPNAFLNAPITSISIPEGVKEIASQAFLGCTLLESVRLPSTLEHLGVGVFAICYSLREVYLPSSLKIVGLLDNHQLYLPDLTFEGLNTETLKVYYEGTEEDFEKIHFTDPYTNPDGELGVNLAQKEHFKSFVVFENDEET